MPSFVRLPVRLALCAWLASAVLLSVALAQGGKPTIEVYKDKAGEYRWRFKAANGKVLAVPEDAYKNHADAKSALESIRKNLAKMKVEYYEDKAKEHRWRLKATNGRVMARSSEGYKAKEGAEKAVGSFKEGVKDAAIVEVK